MVYVPSVYVPGQESNTSQQQQQVHQSSAQPAFNPDYHQQQPSSAASAPAPFGMALNVPPPVQPHHYRAPASAAVVPSPYAPQQQQNYHGDQDIGVAGGGGYYQQQHQQPPQNNYGEPLGTTSNSGSYMAGSGPTNGVVTSPGNPTQCHKVDYEIKGHEMQLVEVVLDPNETVIAEAGGMMYLEDDVDFKAKMGDGSKPNQGFFGKLMSAGGRILTGESLFLTHFTNRGNMPRRVAFASPYPGTIIPVDLLELRNQQANPKASVICQKDAFLCAAKGTKVAMHLHKKLGSGLFGGEGFILQKCSGDGMVFLHAGGCVIQKRLEPGQRLRVDTGCLVAFSSPSIDYDITMVKGLKSMLFGGEGLFLATLTARSAGTVWLQSLPFSRMADRILRAAPSAGGNRIGEGTPLTGAIGDLVDGNGIAGGLGFGGF